ncbi:hypothetical protein ABW21_db0202716 [Orbilia brochopaga]|nr:hypothetical protein ABW21_db0202716 [Drechslerella brochopaga]
MNFGAEFLNTTFPEGGDGRQSKMLGHASAAAIEILSNFGRILRRIYFIWSSSIAFETAWTLYDSITAHGIFPGDRCEVTNPKESRDRLYS